MMSANHLIRDNDRTRVAEAIRCTEEKTSGEIYVVLAHRSDDYFFVAGFVTVCGILFTAIIVSILAHWFWLDVSLLIFGLAILSTFTTLMLLLWLFPALRMVLVPHSIKHHHAHMNALQQFLVHNVRVTQKRSGILLFVSLAEHYAEVVADVGISAKIKQKEWDDIITILTEHASKVELINGFIIAIEKAAQLLEKHFPIERDHLNELDNQLIEL